MGSPTASPTSSSPTISPPPTPTCQPFKFEIKTDQYPGDISWELRSTVTNEVLLSRDSGYYGGVGQNTVDIVSECIVPQCMKFTINDSYGDGLASPAYYKAFWNDGVVLEDTSGGSWSSNSVEFGCVPTAPPNSAPSPTASPTAFATETPTASPTETPTVSPTKAPTASPTSSSPVSCPAGQSLLKIELQANAKSEDENKYTVTERNDSGKFKTKVVNVPSSDLTNGELHVTETCVNDNACFRFMLNDSGKNGLCCEDGLGYYKVTLGGVELQYSIFQNGKKAQFFFSDINSDAC